MRKRGGMAALVTIGMFVLPAAALALCVAVVTGAITINGIVVSTNLPPDRELPGRSWLVGHRRAILSPDLSGRCRGAG